MIESAVAALNWFYGVALAGVIEFLILVFIINGYRTTGKFYWIIRPPLCHFLCVYTRVEIINAMAGKRIETMDLRQLILLKQQGLSNRKVAGLLQISRNTVNGHASIFERTGHTFEHLLRLVSNCINPRT